MSHGYGIAAAGYQTVLTLLRQTLSMSILRNKPEETIGCRRFGVARDGRTARDRPPGWKCHLGPPSLCGSTAKKRPASDRQQGSPLV